jgi:serine/threonine protein kinase
MADQVELGSVFAGHRIEAVAGRGGMGVVYVATHLALNRRVALKLITPDLAADEGFRQRFKQESMTAASIDHPNVIPIYHAGEEDGKLYITMRYVEGTDLREMIATRGKIAPAETARIINEMASALDAAHAHGLVHRDVKPANILIGQSGQAYLTDFGLTKHAGSQSGLTKTGMFVGTLDYIAPEQLQGGEVDGRVDVYALGCVLYQALTGTVPYPRDSEPAKIWAHMQEPPPSVVGHPDVPDQFEGVIARAMAKKPDDRYPSVGDLGRAALAAAKGGEVDAGERTVAMGPAAPPTGSPVPLPPPKRNLLPFAIAGTVLIVIAAIIAVVVSVGGGSDKKPTPTVAANTTTTPAASDEKAKSQIQLALTTTLKAARENDKLVFCGGLSERYQQQQFGGPIQCQTAAANGDIPQKFKSASDASSSTTIQGNKATVITVDGTTFQFVKGPSFWTIDGIG